MSWNYSEAVDQLGKGPMADRAAIHHDNQTISFRELRRRARNIGAWLQSKGVSNKSHVGHYMRNSNAYLETFIGSGMAGCTHVNVNYRYQDQELEKLCNALDIEVLVYDCEFAERVSHIRPRLEKTIAFVEVSNKRVINEFSVSLDELYCYPDAELKKDTASNNEIIIATGGTTGLPKGTQWLQTDVWHKMGVWYQGTMSQAALDAPPPSMEEYLNILENLSPSQPTFVLCPLMHGTGLLTSLSALAQGTAVIITANPHFDPDQCLELIKTHRAAALIIVGDVFALPLLEVLENRQDHQNGAMDSVQVILSSGAIFSDESRARFKQLRNDMVIYDTLGSSESIGSGIATDESGVFTPLPTTRVFDDNMQQVLPGSEKIGTVYSGGYSPIGYYNEPEKSLETFVTIEGQQYVNTGDRCKFRANGKVELLGRDSTVINTGGEKVYTVEVERELIGHPGIVDALVIGLPHPRFGKMVVAVVEEKKSNQNEVNIEMIQTYLSTRLAGYKIPKHVYTIPSLKRFANGKPDYEFIMEYADECHAKTEAATGSPPLN